MVAFDWKYTEKDEWPPEPAHTKYGWQYVDPGMSAMEIQDWWSGNFEVYACKVRGIPGPVPSQLYYIGDGQFMSETGHVFKEGAVEAWDSYTEE